MSFGLTDLSHTSQNTYRRLRDCLGWPSPELEDWLQQNILLLVPELEELLDVSIPTTLLDDESVKQWFGIAERIDMPLCDEMKDVIRKWDFGFEASTPISDELMVRFLPTPFLSFGWDDCTN